MRLAIQYVFLPVSADPSLKIEKRSSMEKLSPFMFDLIKNVFILGPVLVWPIVTSGLSEIKRF